jgi:hypothetical protein
MIPWINMIGCSDRLYREWQCEEVFCPNLNKIIHLFDHDVKIFMSGLMGKTS